MGVITYFLYSPTGEFQKSYQLELTLSVLTLARRLKAAESPIRIGFISDASNARPDLPVVPIILSQEEIGAWTRQGRFYHGAKIHALARALEVFQQPAVLIDSDTTFIGDPALLFERIGPGRSLLHEAEYTIGGAPHMARLCEAAASSKDPELAGLEKAMIYNSGVVGLDPADAGLLSEADALVDKFMTLDPALFLMEQLATSIALARKTTVSECKDVVDHYYGFRRRFILARIRAMFPQLAREAFEEKLASGELPSFDFPPKLLRDRILTKLKFGTKRDVSPFIFLAYRSAFSAGSGNPEVANAWLATALDAIQYNSGLDRAQLRRDLPRLGEWETISWLDAETRARARAFWTHAP